MKKSKMFKTPISVLITLTLLFQLIGTVVLPGTTVSAASKDIYSSVANQKLDSSDPLDVVLKKPYRGSTVTKSGSTGNITIELPYGTFYQMLHPVVNPDSTVKVYESNGEEIVRLTGVNNGDYELGLKDSNGNRVVPGWAGGKYFLDVSDGKDTRRYTIEVTIQDLSNFTLTRSLPGGGTESINNPEELVAPMNIRANEHGFDTWGSTYIGYGDTGLNSIEAPMKPSSYSGKNWFDSSWGPDVYVHTANDMNKFKPAGVSNDLPKDDREIPLDWYGDNMYIQTIAKDNSDGRIDAYGVDVKYDGKMNASGKIAGFDKIQSDIIRMHKFDAPINAPGHEDGDRGAASSNTQRLEMKTNYTPENFIANDGPGTITTHFWRLLVPSETVKRQKQVGNNAIGTWSPNNYNYVYQIKEAKGNANASPTIGIGLRSNATLSFEHSRNNSTPGGMQSAGGSDTGTFLTLSREQFVDRWIDIELTTETADFGHVYVRVTDTDTGELIGQGTLNDSDMLRRNTELQLPKALPAPAAGPIYREGNYNTLKNDKGENVNFGRSKWGIYGNFPASGVGREEWQSSTIYMADITIIKRDRDSYVFPNGYKPTSKDSNLRVMGWEHQNQMKVPLGTKITDLTLKTELESTLSNGFTVTIPVEWDTSNYRPTIPGVYKIYGQLQPPDGITIPNAPDNYYSDYYKPYFEINNSTVHDWGKAVMGADIKIVSHNEEARKENVLDEDRTAMTTSEGYAFFQSGSSFEMDAGRTPWRYWVALDLGQKIDISSIEVEFGTMGSPGRSRNSSAWWTNDAEAYEALIESYNNFYNPLDPALAAGQKEPDREYYEANNWPTKNPLGVENLVGYDGPWNYFVGSGRQPSNVNSQGTSVNSNWNPLIQPALKGGTLGTNYTLGRRATDVLANNDGEPITARYVMVVNELNFFSSLAGAPGSVKGSSPGPMQFLDFAVIGELHDELADLMVLETLTVDGVPVTEFDPNSKNYTHDIDMNLPIPTVEATISEASEKEGIVIDIIQATEDEKTAVVRISRSGGKDVFYLVTLNEVYREYTVSYDANTGSGTAPADSLKGTGTEFAAEENNFTAPEGLEFLSWNTAPDGSGTSYAEGEIITMPPSDLTLYAIWYDPIAINEDITAAKEAIMDEAFTVLQENVNDEVTAKAYVEGIINALNLNGVTATVIDDTFTAAIGGTSPDDLDGTNGSYTFTVELSKGLGIPQVTELLTLTIIATAYNPALITVTFESLTANGSSETTTTELILTLGEAIPELELANITVTGATLNSVMTDDTVSTLSISDITVEDGESVTVALSKAGYVFSPQHMTVPVYKVADSLSVTVSPSTATVRKGSTQTFTAVVEGTNNPEQAVIWTIEGNVQLHTGTTISSNGVLTVSGAERASTITVTATSEVDPTKSDTATVTVIAAPRPNPDPKPDPKPDTNNDTDNGGSTGETDPVISTTPTIRQSSTERQDQIIQDATKADSAITIAGPASEITLNSTEVMQLVSLVVTPAVAAKVTTYAYMESDGTIVPVPTVIDPYTGVVTLLVSSSGDYFPITVSKQFKDIESSKWYAESVVQAANLLIVSGYADSFRPNDSVTVAESVAMFMRTIGFGVNPEAKTTTDAWFGKTLATAESKGLMEGITALSPSSKIERKSAAQIVATSLKLAGVDTTLSPEEVEELLAPFKDVATLTVSEKNALAICAKYKIFIGFGDGTMRPDTELTRAQMAIVAVNVQKTLLDLKKQSH